MMHFTVLSSFAYTVHAHAKNHDCFSIRLERLASCLTSSGTSRSPSRSRTSTRRTGLGCSPLAG